MLGLHLYTLISGHQSCSMLTRLNKLTLQKKLQNVVTNNVFWTKKSKNTTTTKSKHKNPCRSRDLKLGRLAPKPGALPLYHWSLRVRIVVKHFNCFDAMDRNVKNKAKLAGHTFATL